MDENLKKALQEELQAFKTNLGSFATPEDVENLKNDLVQRIEESKDDSLKGQLDDLQGAVEKVTEQMLVMNQQEETEKALDEQIHEKMDDLKNVIKNKSGSVGFTLKTDVTRSSVTNHTLGQRLPDIGQLAFKNTKLEGFFRRASVGPNSNGTIRYVDQSSVTRNAAGVAEAGTKPESAIAWQEYTLPIEVYADTIPVTMQSMTQVDFVAGEINNFLANNLRLKIDTDLYAGDGVSPNIFGAYTRAATFTPAASGITDANIYDLIVKVIEDITTSSQYEPNLVILPHALFSQLILKKDSQNNYVIPPFSSILGPTGSVEGGIMVNGAMVIPSASATANTMVVGDFNYATLWNLGGVQVDLGWINAQFVENMMTIRAERQLGMLIRNAHQNAFRKVTSVSAALTTLAT
jgi:HK97 family phage major capsid protein